MTALSELNLYLTQLHPKLPLGNESLKQIKLSRSTYSETFSKGPIFLIKPRAKVPDTQTPMPEAPASPMTVPKPPLIAKRSIKDLLPPSSSLKTFTDSTNNKKYKQTLIKLSEKEEIPQKRKINSSCPACDWEFPLHYCHEDIEKHVNLCIEIKMTQADLDELEKKIKKKDDSDDSNDEELSKIQEEIEKKCPHCGLRIGKRSQEFQKRHVKECFDEANQPYATNKVLYQELGTIPKKTIDSCSKKLILRRIN